MGEVVYSMKWVQRQTQVLCQIENKISALKTAEGSNSKSDEMMTLLRQQSLIRNQQQKYLNTIQLQNNGETQ